MEAVGRQTKETRVTGRDCVCSRFVQYVALAVDAVRKYEIGSGGRDSIERPRGS